MVVKALGIIYSVLDKYYIISNIILYKGKERGDFPPSMICTIKISQCHLFTMETSQGCFMQILMIVFKYTRQEQKICIQ